MPSEYDFTRYIALYKGFVLILVNLNFRTSFSSRIQFEKKKKKRLSAPYFISTVSNNHACTDVLTNEKTHYKLKLINSISSNGIFNIDRYWKLRGL